MSLQANDLFDGRYRLIEERGRGAFGEVWLARDEELDMEVAVKIYIALDDRGIEEFKSEYRNVFDLKHSNILRADHYDVCDNRPYLVMSYCPESASSLIGSVDEGTVWQFINDVARGLAYLHDKGIVHRDIKPDNILRDKEGIFVITDFGVSKRMRSTLRRNSTRGPRDVDVSGTIGYMAPELFSSRPDAVKATDIWALGATIYEMMTGELPFMGQGGVMLLHGAEVPTLGEEFSQELNDIVSACLSCETWQRPTAEELAVYAIAHLSGKEAPMAWLSRSGEGEVTDSPEETIPIADAFQEKKTISIRGKGDRDSVIRQIANDMVFVKGGTFAMGATSEQGFEYEDIERPVFSMTVSDFYISKYEVTQAQWVAIMGSNPSYFKGENLPVEQVSWNDVQEFIKRLNTLTGLNYGLPKEPEWEYAARGGNMSRGYKYSGGNDIESVAWCYENSESSDDNAVNVWDAFGENRLFELSGAKDERLRMTHPVGTKTPNELGLYDMSGNVWEWTADSYLNYSTGIEEILVGSTGPDRMIRGGAWLFKATYSRVSSRVSFGADAPTPFIGFRLVCRKNSKTELVNDGGSRQIGSDSNKASFNQGSNGSKNVAQRVKLNRRTMSFGEAIGSAFSHYFNFKGRARRSEFWFFVLFNMVIGVFIYFLPIIYDAYDLTPFFYLYLIYAIFTFFPNLSVLIRRLHDTGTSGWYVLINLLPLVGSILLLFQLCQKGDEGTNEYGPDPRYY